MCDICSPIPCTLLGPYTTPPKTRLLDATDGGEVYPTEGSNPMGTVAMSKTDAFVNAPQAYAKVEAAVSDEAKKVKYLAERARSTYFNLEDKLYGQFNLNVSNAPKTYKELVDAIKGDKFKIDPIVELKMAAGVEDFKFRSPFYGIIWDGPQPDRKGYDKAAADLRDKFREVNDVINVKSADDGLAALQDFEKWVPAGLPN